MNCSEASTPSLLKNASSHEMATAVGGCREPVSLSLPSSERYLQPAVDPKKCFWTVIRYSLVLVDDAAVTKLIVSMVDCKVVILLCLAAFLLHPLVVQESLYPLQMQRVG